MLRIPSRFKEHCGGGSRDPPIQKETVHAASRGKTPLLREYGMDSVTVIHGAGRLIMSLADGRNRETVPLEGWE